MHFLKMSESEMVAFKKNSNWFLVWGVLLIILGVFAISFAIFTTLISIIFLGVLLIVSGVISIIDSFHFWWKKWKGFLLHLIIAILYLLAGVTLVMNPVMGAISLTLFLSILYIVLGIFRIVYSLSIDAPAWKWRLFSGILAVILGILIYMQLPLAGLFIIGLFVGIDLIISGIVYIMGSFAGRSASAV